MDKIKIKGGFPLNGKIQISGAKNAALPIMAASLLTKDTLVLSNIPNLADIVTMVHLVVQHGVSLSVDGNSFSDHKQNRILLLNGSKIDNFIAPYDIVRKMRASVLVLGPLVARFGKAKVSLPGGCAIGTRPIDLHLDALEQMGAKIELSEGYVNVEAPDKLHGAEIHFSKVSVGATENILMAATLAKGTTIIHNAAREPEIVDLGNCLKAMGAKIEGLGTSSILIKGVEELHGAHHQIISDRIEAGTFAVAAAITKGDIELTNIDHYLIDNITEKLIQSGIKIEHEPNKVFIKAGNSNLAPFDITTQAFPGFPTDMQAQFMALASVTEGTSVISETIFENRYMHVPELNRMGANISVNGNSAVIRGVQNLLGAEVMATDLRASVSLVLAGLVAKGETTINRVYHIDRGYERIEEKLRAVGAEIMRVKG